MSKTETQSVALSLALLLRMQRDSASGVVTHNAASRAAAELEWLDAENKALRGLAATCYAGLGAECNLPENWLDALNAAANGEAFDTKGLLPFTAGTVAARDAAFEAVRQRLCKVPRWSFHLDSRGNIRRVDDASGNWIEFSAAHQLFDPVAVDAAIAAR
ncbi:hypothetical protein N5K37_32635, partial [Delftia tsuruhatensis]|uniref:hypothetical protein n=1 Tax=Delftia tsuruhatensis TaxID=180282 RepID=UPI0024472632